MTRNEMLKHLSIEGFEPFTMVMNNGETFEVRHPENAVLTREDSLYVFEPAFGEPGVKHLVKILRIHNICTITKLAGSTPSTTR
jgi:hypothetical protein